MTSFDAIGGYFGLELKCNFDLYHQNALALNSGRNALEYILRTKKIKRIAIPYYICDVILEPLNKLEIDYQFYHIDRQMFPFPNVFNDNICLLYVNYFGVLNHKIPAISDKYKNMILDNSQAFFSKPLKGVPTFYSPRKFFGVPDGGFAFCDGSLKQSLQQDISYQRCSHLLIRADTNAKDGYSEFQKNDASLNNQPMKKMSQLTDGLLRNIDYEQARIVRNKNFACLHQRLKSVNEASKILVLDKIDGPMVYPFLRRGNANLRKRLQENKVYTAQYWPNLAEWLDDKSCFEYYLYENLIPLPIDQRYGISEMKRILEIVTRNV